MSELSMMVTITNRSTTAKFISLYERHGAGVALETVGAGTAANEILDYFGLQKAEKAVIFSFVTNQTWKAIRRDLQSELQIDIPGTGVVFTVPLSSVGGKKPLYFLLDDQPFQKEEESSLKQTKYELLVVVANQGYTNLVMDAAREENATGGTVIHAKGTGMQRAEQFLGMSLVSEKEMVLLVVKSEQKNQIMKAVMEKAGLQSKAQSILFSLPVTSTAGMRLMEQAADED